MHRHIRVKLRGWTIVLKEIQALEVTYDESTAKPLFARIG